MRNIFLLVIPFLYGCCTSNTEKITIESNYGSQSLSLTSTRANFEEYKNRWYSDLNDIDNLPYWKLAEHVYIIEIYSPAKIKAFEKSLNRYNQMPKNWYKFTQYWKELDTLINKHEREYASPFIFWTKKYHLQQIELDKCAFLGIQERIILYREKKKNDTIYAIHCERGSEPNFFIKRIIKMKKKLTDSPNSIDIICKNGKFYQRKIYLNRKTSKYEYDHYSYISINNYSERKITGKDTTCISDLNGVNGWLCD